MILFTLMMMVDQIATIRKGFFPHCSDFQNIDEIINCRKGFTLGEIYIDRTIDVLHSTENPFK